MAEASPQPDPEASRTVAAAREAWQWHHRPLLVFLAEPAPAAFRIQPDRNAVLLVGKDGGVKERTGLDVDLKQIFTRIDGMPIRQAEMRRQARDGEGPR
ncbi:MAG: DUF4174 domain-containing protein [Opitutales bacterium]